MCCMLVRRGSSYVGVVEALSFDARPFPRKETCLLEGRMPCNALLARALTLGVSRGGLDWTFRPTLCILLCSGSFGGEGCKKNDRTGACFLSRFP